MVLLEIARMQLLAILVVLRTRFLKDLVFGVESLCVCSLRLGLYGMVFVFMTPI